MLYFFIIYFVVLVLFFRWWYVIGLMNKKYDEIMEKNLKEKNETNIFT